MPLYEYQCESCEHRFEKIQKFSDPAPEACPKCGAPVRKLMSSPAIQFKGTGWYITDYAKKSSTDAGKGGSGRSDSGGDKGDSSSKTDTSDSSSGKSTEPAAATTTTTPKT
jgi:putative FmdB family regulatory protein